MKSWRPISKSCAAATQRDSAVSEVNSAVSDLRRATVERITGETSISLTLTIDGSGQADVQTGIGFLDHMLTLWARHGLFDLIVRAQGDLHVDEHHTAEDVCICLGRALDQALGPRAGIVRTAHSFVPMDEALALVAIDLGGRPYCVVQAEFTTPRVGQLSTDLIVHLFESIAFNSRCNLHAQVFYGRNDHHKIEALFKAMGRAFDAATRLDPRLGGTVPSTKGVL
ncbi:MAG: imidazoleglycerol-phosphate dehydratase HisB [Chloroflexus sp.]